MVLLGSLFLASALGAQTLWAARIPRIPLGERDVGRHAKRGKVSEASYCPEQIGMEKWECKDPLCGGEDPKHKGQCLLPVLQAGNFKPDDPQKPLVVTKYCKCGPKGSGDGNNPPPIIVIPPPVGYVPPPAGVPPVRSPNKCPEDYSNTSCKECKPLEGWCTVGPKAGCPCREECPKEDDKKPKCGDVTCQGSDSGKCTVGHYVDCECKDSCPDQEKEVLDCSADECKKDKDKDKCTSDDFKNCACSVVYHDKDYLPGTIAEMKQIESILGKVPEIVENSNKPDPKPEAKCSSNDYSKAVDVDTQFMNRLAEKYCSGKDDKATLTAKDIESDAYQDYSFDFEYTKGEDCKTECTDAYSKAISKCMGFNSHSIQLEGTVDFSCGTKYTYKINPPKKSTPTGSPPPATTTSSGKLGSQHCHKADQFGDHGDVRGRDISMAATGCAGGDGVMMKPGSDPIKLTSQYGGTWLQFTTSWIDDCRGPEQDSRYPFGGKQILGNSCWQLFLNDWQHCNNGGAGGYIEAGCVRYDFRPTNE